MGFPEAKFQSECCDICHRHGRRLLPADHGVWCCDDCYEQMREEEMRAEDTEEGFDQ